ncbi:hypothetical protein M116_4236 [Bacteroides fragilis str. 3719 A10]|nr:hypothetical protein M116_4236 [Bacteroides fragilis str. 3719 A10]EXZ87318.1 hypothetical protein M068_4119 [Bacteroides fragilis str. J38-1]OCR28841.1 hypothetical protein AC141_43690 [Bacteroides fragilis]
MKHHAFCRRRAANVAEANEKYFLFHAFLLLKYKDIKIRMQQRAAWISQLRVSACGII